MVNFPGRNGRRRRVLNDELLSAPSTRTAFNAADDEELVYPALRYSDAAGVEHHPQITDFVPRRYRTIAMLVIFGVASTVALDALHQAVPWIASSIGVADVPPLNLASEGSVAVWISAMLLLVASAVCLMIYSLRRHRIDDYRGRYRIWMVASVACLVLSTNSIAGFHQLLAHALSHVTNWTALRDNSVWWLVACSLPAIWLAIRILLDVVECRLGATLWIAAIFCYLVAGASYFGLASSFQSHDEVMVHASITLIGHWLLLAMVLSYARFVVLDAQGLIPLRTRSPRSASSASVSDEQSAVTTSRDRNKSAGKATLAAPAAEDRDWVDGSRPERDPYEADDGEVTNRPRKLSKADRKKLRKLKAQNRAA